MDLNITTGKPTTARIPLIVAGSLLITGTVANTIVSTFHPSHADPNNHPAVFAEYAASATWIGVHYAQYACVLTTIAGFVVLYRALTIARRPSAVDHLVLAAAITSAAALTVLQAIVGVALKHSVDAWAAAAEPDKAGRFAAAETMRWLEWGANSYFYTLIGLTLALAGAAMLRGAVPRWLGWTGIIAGAAFVVNAVPVGYRGFEATPSGYVAVALFAVTAIGIIVAGVRTRRYTAAGPDNASVARAYAIRR
ncbi:MAG TPA: hypothetical protein VFH03_26750 [Actinoplanes sp.]|nr:hypothetical protein [Actinoplanes sp.]